MASPEALQSVENRRTQAKSWAERQQEELDALRTTGKPVDRSLLGSAWHKIGDLYQGVRTTFAEQGDPILQRETNAAKYRGDTFSESDIRARTLEAERARAVQDYKAKAQGAQPLGPTGAWDALSKRGRYGSFDELK